jgi:hypothetical protein
MSVPAPDRALEAPQSPDASREMLRFFLEERLELAGTE